MCGSAETQRGPASCHDATSYPGDESLRRSYPGGEVVGILKKLQIGAGERRTVPAGHGFKTTATIEVAVDDDERNDAESERRRLERAAEQPSTKWRPTPAETGDVARRRKRALTHDRDATCSQPPATTAGSPDRRATVGIWLAKLTGHLFERGELRCSGGVSRRPGCNRRHRRGQRGPWEREWHWSRSGGGGRGRSRRAPQTST